jgi:hypothetical protein
MLADQVHKTPVYTHRTKYSNDSMYESMIDMQGTCYCLYTIAVIDVLGNTGVSCLFPHGVKQKSRMYYHDSSSLEHLNLTAQNYTYPYTCYNDAYL